MNVSFPSQPEQGEWILLGAWDRSKYQQRLKDILKTCQQQGISSHDLKQLGQSFGHNVPSSQWDGEQLYRAVVVFGTISQVIKKISPKQFQEWLNEWCFGSWDEQWTTHALAHLLSYLPRRSSHS